MLGKGYKVHKPSEGAVLITGSTRGLGYDMATRFYEKGYTVLGTVRKEKDYNRWCDIGKSEAGGNIVPIYLDTSVPEKVDQAVKTVKEFLAKNKLKLTAVICNAGVINLAPFEADEMSTFKWIFSTKVEGHI